MIEKDATGIIVDEYSGSAPSAIGKSRGTADIKIDVRGATPTSELPEGHYYVVESAFRMNVDGVEKDICLEIDDVKVLRAPKHRIERAE